MSFEKQLYPFLQTYSKAIPLKKPYSLDPADAHHSSPVTSKWLEAAPDKLKYSGPSLDSHHRLVGHLSKLALEETQLLDLFQKTGKLLVQELDLTSCEFWETLIDKDTLKLVDYTASNDILTCPISGFEPRSLSQTFQEAQGSHEMLHSSSGCQERLLRLGAQKYGLVIPGPSFPAGVVILTSSLHQLIGQRELNLLRDVSSILATAWERKRAEMLLLTQTNVLQAIASGSDLQQTLLFLCQLLEQQHPGAYCSILFLNAEKQQLESGIAPSLPKAYAQALNGLVIGSCAGSCGTAAFRGEPVFVDDISIDPLWAPFRELALSNGIRSCWSMPFLSQSGDVLGTFALSFEIACKPTTGHLQIMETATHLASIATERFQATHKLTQLALYDDLTGLVNRTFFADYLSHRLQGQHDTQSENQNALDQPFALLFLDLDRFKLVNDSLGHMAGDQLLIAFTKRIIPCLKPEDVFARLGGDEFAILLEKPLDRKQIEHFADELLNSLRCSILLESNEMFVTASIGIVQVDGQYQQPQELLRDADIAMYEAKKKYQDGGYVFFNEYMHTAAHNRLQLELELRRDIEALSNGTTPAFFLTYQPIVASATEELMGFEVLWRWAHTQKGIIMPDKFISILEETGLILPLGDWVLETACSQLQKWRKNYPEAQNLTVSINVSGKQFLHPDLVSKVSALLNKYELPPNSLRLELTESVLIATATTVSNCFNALKSLGVLISLDDFGTGYSSLSYLQDLPVDHLKIDRSFIAELEKGGNSIVQAVINLSHNLGMQAVAEGVENTEQLSQLVDLGCDFCQGYLFSKPLLVQDATAMIVSCAKSNDANF